MKLLALAACLYLASAFKFGEDFNCSGMPDGLAWWGCKSYGKCINGVHNKTDCMGATAFSQVDEDCVTEENAGFPCNRQVDCSALKDTVHRMPELDYEGNSVPCQFYYTCNYGNFAGHQICGNGLVYSEEDQNCLAPEFVREPCGTLFR